MAIVIAGIVLLGGGGDDDASPTTPAASSAPPDTFFDTLEAPTSVTVALTGAGVFTVDVAPVDGATGYEIQPVGSGVDTVSVGADGLPATVDAPGATSLCVVVRALGEGGRISRDSEPACSG